MGRFISLVVFALLLGAPASAQTFKHAAAAYERGDFTVAREAWRKLAEKGDAQSQFMLGALYATGKGVARDHAEAAKWYLKSAKQGLAAAQNNLGFMYDRGLGVPQSDHEAVRWYIGAAEQGHAQAQNNLGVMYGTGRGVAQNNAKALKWFQLSADQGNPQARYNLNFLRNKERSRVAERSLSKPAPSPPPSEVSITEESVTPNRGLAPAAPQETQVATTSAVPEAVIARDKPAEVKLEAIVSKKVSPDLKVEEKKPAQEPRLAPSSDDSGPVAALAKIKELKGPTPKPAPAPEAVKTTMAPKTPLAKPEIARTSSAPSVSATGTEPRDVLVGAERITLTPKTQIAALVKTKPKAAATAKKGRAAKVKDAGAALAKVRPAENKAGAQIAKGKAGEGKPGKAKTPTYQVQLGAVRAKTAAGAAKAVGKLKQTHRPVLDGVKVFTMRADLGARGTYYRLRAGPFADAFAAQEICDKLKARKQPCFVLRR